MKTLGEGGQRHSYPESSSPVTVAADSKFLCSFVGGESAGSAGLRPSFSGKTQWADGVWATVCDDLCMLHASVKRGYHAMALHAPLQTHLLVAPQREKKTWLQLMTGVTTMDLEGRLIQTHQGHGLQRGFHCKFVHLLLSLLHLYLLIFYICSISHDE